MSSRISPLKTNRGAAAQARPPEHTETHKHAAALMALARLLARQAAVEWQRATQSATDLPDNQDKAPEDA